MEINYFIEFKYMSQNQSQSGTVSFRNPSSAYNSKVNLLPIVVSPDLTFNTAPSGTETPAKCTKQKNKDRSFHDN